MLAIMAFMALAIDLGMLAVARTQCQDAADAAAMAGARTLNGVTANSANNNYSNVSPNAIAAVTANSVLGKSLTSSQLTLQHRPLLLCDGRSTVRRAVSRPVDPELESGAGPDRGQREQPIGLLQDLQLHWRQHSDHEHGRPAPPRHRDRARLLGLDAVLQPAGRGLRHGHPRYEQSRHELSDVGALFVGQRRALGLDAQRSPYDSANITTTTSDGRPPIVQDFYTNTSRHAGLERRVERVLPPYPAAIRP